MWKTMWDNIFFMWKKCAKDEKSVKTRHFLDWQEKKRPLKLLYIVLTSRNVHHIMLHEPKSVKTAPK